MDGLTVSVDLSSGISLYCELELEACQLFKMSEVAFVVSEVEFQHLF